ncbi:hypothetical protein [Beggiatoa leptomitoformis]|uniref:Uncharacterized protein n=1 Tax=Beggiatoa leptomitoformis TaxID=288004 RepID=A0A2N9YF84_9GAMM|nr:hypothetical protein [Beggiatoa leptomitoformis]ALG68534.1 hypothetical protein AL038_13540 [Beggiatoa leptomitoformis]AUI69123.1 hypothetical protein BLE401_10720 [Beggiatoa leptomitoformis]
MTEYTVIFSPELDIQPAEFATFWNAQSQLQQQAVAQVQDAQKTAHYEMDGLTMMALIFIGNFALDIFKDVTKDAIKDFLKKRWLNKPEQKATEFDLIEKKTEDGKTLIIVLPKQN